VALWIAGAGGVGREALDVAMACGVEVAGFVDDRTAGGEVRGLNVLRPADVPGGATYLVAIGDPSARLDVARRLAAIGHTPASLVHPRAIVGPLTEIDAGCLVSGGAHVSSSVTIGPHAQVHYNATMGHDCVLDDGVTVLPGANVAGTVHLQRAVTVGSGAIVLQGLTVGEGAVVGAGAVVTRDVPAGSTVVGSPARPIDRR
jgi:sugar O-acyltransferase (sialic acid O-acetyltransferase NeuD family)